MRALKITPAGKVTEEDVDVMKLGYYIERVQGMTLRSLLASCSVSTWPMPVMIVDEDGISKRLPGNYKASMLYDGHRYGHFIYGDAYLVAEDEVWSPVDGHDCVFIDLPTSITIEMIEKVTT